MAGDTGAFTVGRARLSKFGDVQKNSVGGVQSYEDEYTVVMQDNSVRANENNVQGLPKLESKSEKYKDCEVTSYTFTQMDPKSRVWTVTVHYEVVQGSAASTSGGGKSKKILELEYLPYTHTVDFTKDMVTSEAVLNSASDVFDSVPQIDVSDISIHIKIASNKLDTDILDMNGTVNKSSVKLCNFSFLKHCALVEVNCKDRLSKEAGYRYEYDFKISRRQNKVKYIKGGETEEDIGWDVAVLDSGFNEKGDNGELVPILIEDDNGKQRTPKLPVLLDGTGKRQTRTITGGKLKPYYFKFSPYAESDFTKLTNFGIPATT
jgi:hypothetical protein